MLLSVITANNSIKHRTFRSVDLLQLYTKLSMWTQHAHISSLDTCLESWDGTCTMGTKICGPDHLRNWHQSCCNVLSQPRMARVMVVFLRKIALNDGGCFGHNRCDSKIGRERARSTWKWKNCMIGFDSRLDKVKCCHCHGHAAACQRYTAIIAALFHPFRVTFHFVSR